MSVAIHPYKGYLNTLFHVQVTGTDAVEYHVLRKSQSNDTEIGNGKVYPNEPFSFQIPVPGEFLIECSDGTSVPLTIEDGYKYGGSKFKNAFVFDNCPWVFIVMHDRTYFYNRMTHEAYVEAISPDKITVLSSEYVILENKNHAERSIYSLTEQKPVLSISNIVFYNSEVIVWSEENDDKKTLVLCSLSDRNRISRAIVDLFAIDDKSQRLIISHEDKIEIISLTECLEHDTKTFSFCGNIVDIIAPNIVISYEVKSYGKSVYAYDIDNDKLIKRIEIKGHLARIGDNSIVDVWKRKQAIQNFDITETEFPEAIISADYYEFDFYPCDWEIFYTEKRIHLEKVNPYRVNRTEECKLHSCLKEFNQPLQNTFSHFLIYNDNICLYNDQESFVRNKTYSAAGYKNIGAIYKDGNHIYLYEEDTIFTLSRNGYWDKGSTHKYDFKHFSDYGVIFNDDRGILQSLGGYRYGKYKTTRYRKTGSFIITDEAYIFPDRRILRVKGKDIDVPDFLSQSLKFGLTVDDEGVYLFEFDGQEYAKMEILEKIFDTSKYHDVLLSEDGNSIMHRNGTNTIVVDIANGTEEVFNNVSFIKQANGIRPLFEETPSSLQPRLINPVTMQPLDCKTMSQYQFISPDGNLYADSRLKEYIEFYWLIDNKTISIKEFSRLTKKYEYPWQENHESPNWKEITNIRKIFIQDHFDFLNAKFPHLLHNDPTGEKWEKSVLDEDNKLGTLHFLERLIGKKGIAYIRRSSDDSIFAKIDLGEPLTYINYVSFSYDSKYMALAGYRGDRNSSWGGLFLIYNLINKSVVAYQNTGRAVWVTAFSKSNALASYTSNPFTFFAKNEYEYDYDDFKSKVIDHRSFLTFSPNGCYFALSDQGYVSKYDRHGRINSGWGHKPSSLVEIRHVEDPDNQIIQFYDLSDVGIDDVATQATCVAAVSFSNNNKRLMMVGKDGVVIVRNLNFDDYASE